MKVKRSHTDLESQESSLSHLRDCKRLRLSGRDYLSLLSDELLLRILIYLPVEELLVCERLALLLDHIFLRLPSLRLSVRFNALATDSLLWKFHYYSRFIQPRVARASAIHNPSVHGERLHFHSFQSKWHHEKSTTRDSSERSWKKRYKLRHNWARGCAHVTETAVIVEPRAPVLLVKLHGDIIIIVDVCHGLRAWSLKQPDRALATTSLNDIFPRTSSPTCIAIDTASQVPKEEIGVAVGFSTGALALFRFNSSSSKFHCWHKNTATNEIALTSIAFSGLFLLCMTSESTLSLFSVKQTTETTELKLVSALKSHTAYAPMSLGLRVSAQVIVASMAYILPSLNGNFSIGIQEIRMTCDGLGVETRNSTAKAATTLRSSLHPVTLKDQDHSSYASDFKFVNLTTTTRNLPSSLSYNHPYVLVSYPDNTLTFYQVTSNATTLSISTGTKLWGHTSAIDGTHIGERGKAVSISCNGNELRIWDLECRRVQRALSKCRDTVVQSSIPIFSYSQADSNFEIVRNRVCWVSFNDEKVISVQERSEGGQAFRLYDFT